MEEIDKNVCLHCGTGEPGYCEECYQELISRNSMSQALTTFVVTAIKDKIKEYKMNIAHMEKADPELFSQQIIADTISMCTLTDLLGELGIGM